jgi:hypothetical protein
MNQAGCVSGDDDPPLPVLVKHEIGELPDGNLVIRLTYATSLERYDAGQFDVAVFALERRQASELGTALRRTAAAKNRRRPH